ARRLCDRCKEPAEYTDEDLARLKFPQVEISRRMPGLFKPMGCQQCSMTGYRGRLALHEVMTVTEEIERLAVARKSSAEIGRVAREQGMLTLREDGFTKATMGLTSLEEILRVVV